MVSPGGVEPPPSSLSARRPYQLGHGETVRRVQGSNLRRTAPCRRRSKPQPSHSANPPCAPTTGLEPAAYRSTGGCSPTELRRRGGPGRIRTDNPRCARAVLYQLELRAQERAAYPGRDSNAHCAGSKPAASYQLGYPGMWSRRRSGGRSGEPAAGLEPAISALRERCTTCRAAPALIEPMAGLRARPADHGGCSCPRRESNAHCTAPQTVASAIGLRGREAASGGFEPPSSGSEPGVLPVAPARIAGRRG